MKNKTIEKHIDDNNRHIVYWSERVKCLDKNCEINQK